jgi:hypothetical protein
VVSKGLDDESLEQFGVLGAGAEKPGTQRLAGLKGHDPNVAAAHESRLKRS